MRLHRERIEAALELLEKVLTGAVSSRPALVMELKRLYGERGIEPLRGLSREGIYDKEVATVHVVGRLGAGVLEPGSFDDIFYVENRCEEAVEAIRSVTEVLTDGARERLERALGGMKGDEEERIFRVLRYVFTATLLGYMPEIMLVKALRTFEAAYPRYSEKFLNYAAFYSAYRIAELIATGAVRTAEDLKIHKYSYCLKLGFQRCKPSDRLIAEVASAIYKVDRQTLQRLFAKGAIPKVA